MRLHASLRRYTVAADLSIDQVSTKGCARACVYVQACARPCVCEFSFSSRIPRCARTAARCCCVRRRSSSLGWTRAKQWVWRQREEIRRRRALRFNRAPCGRRHPPTTHAHANLPLHTQTHIHTYFTLAASPNEKAQRMCVNDEHRG